MPSQDFMLSQTVRVPLYDVETTVIGVAEPDRRPIVDEDDYREGYRYLVEIQIAPKLVWLTADELELVDPEAGTFFESMVPANSP